MKQPRNWLVVVVLSALTLIGLCLTQGKAAGPESSLPKPLGHWMVGQIQDGKVADSSGNGHTTVLVKMTDAALVNAVATATEAKSQALAELGFLATGTATDACCTTWSPTTSPIRTSRPPRTATWTCPIFALSARSPAAEWESFTKPSSCR